ncbi:MAG: hypothetical protein P8R42_19460 [Candidatus Binatia bacterium]|nr:hypothetical protein [Candidatus Binatia bacterium]
MSGKNERSSVRRHREEVARLRTLADDWRQSVLPPREPGRPDRVAVAVVPSNDRRTARLPADRRSRFVGHLKQLIEEVEQEVAELDPADGRERARGDTQHSSPMLGDACATCRGHCCLTAGEHAYLDSPDIRRFWSTRPTATGASIAKAYLGALPERSFSGSCVFHATAGCALPREMRAEICNTFLCDGAQALKAELADGGADRAFLVATGGGELRRATLVDAEGTRRRVRRR